MKPNTKGFDYKDDGTSIFSERFNMFPYGASNREKKTREKLSDLMKKVEPKDGYRAKKLIVKDDELSGNLRIIGTVVDQGKLKTELTQKVLKLSAFRNVVKKRKMSLDVESNQKKKCARRTSPPELFVDAFNEHLEAEIDTIESLT